MFYDAELAFFRKLMQNYHMRSLLVNPDTIGMSTIDLGLRKLLGLESDYEQLLHFFTNRLKPNTIYKVIDAFYCTYFVLLLPDTETTTFLVLGPYTTQDITRQNIMQLIEKYAVPPQACASFEKYFNNILFLPGDTLFSAPIKTFGETIWGDFNNFSMETIEYNLSANIIPTDVKLDFEEQTDTTASMQAMEIRYESENRFLQAVSQGLYHKAELLTDNIASLRLEQRAVDPLRNLQNYCIITNTLLRKAAENGSVHPLYIDRLSSDFARKIELITSQEGAHKLIRDMVHKYCLLVKNHASRGYSILIQRVITKIDSDLTADLSLQALAGYLNINASYLSTLFKKETGSTLTDYVNHKRIANGILLLNSTTLQIQTIAQYCGIPDVNYFTKMFKKQVGKTPSEYRDSVLQNSIHKG